jgi:hypothetical protein
MGRRRRGALNSWRLEGTPTGKNGKRDQRKEKREGHGAHSGSAV